MKVEMARSGAVISITFAFDRTLDHAQVAEMAQVVEGAMETDSELRLLLDLRLTESFETGAFVSPKGILASLKSIGPVSRYAVVGAPGIAAAAVEAFGKILPLKSRAFAAEEIEEARRWISGQPA